MSGPPKTVLEFFNALADNYEKSVGGCTRDISRHIVDILPPLSSSSVVLDNACGNGAVAQELLFKKAPDGFPTVHCVDGAPAMVDLAKELLEHLPNGSSIKFDVAPGESLPYADGTFSHSITNMGILFFADGLKGAQEIYRTLKPGGTAVVTSWAHLGYQPVVQQAQKVVKPESPPFQVPINQAWFTAEYLESVLREGGFKDVEIHEQGAYYGLGHDVKGVTRLLEAFLPPLTAQWTEEEKAALRQELEKAAEGPVETFDRPGEKSLVGLPMTALVAVAKK